MGFYCNTKMKIFHQKMGIPITKFIENLKANKNKQTNKNQVSTPKMKKNDYSINCNTYIILDISDVMFMSRFY